MPDAGTTYAGSEDWHKHAGIDKLSDKDTERVIHVDLEALKGRHAVPVIVWLGHASFLILWKGLRILVDPIFSRFAGIMPRRCPVLPDWQYLRPDFILLSHAHVDHLDLGTLATFPDTKLLVPRNSERFLTKGLRMHCKPLSEGDAWVTGSIHIMAVPALHGGWRYPWQTNCRALGFVLKDGENCIYYAGDTAYGPHFKEIENEFSVNTALLPIGAYSPQWFLQSRHLNPEEAVAAFKETGARRMIPFHFGAYRLSLEPLHEPLPRFARVASQKGVDWFLPVGI